MMTNKKRRILLKGLWTSPVIASITLPIHAICSEGCDDQPVPRLPRISVNDTICAESLPSIVTFNLCNFEDEAVKAIAITTIEQAFVDHVSPGLPFIIMAGESVSCTVKGVSSSEFNCSAQYVCGYQFISESGIFEGETGFVSLENK